MIVDAFLEWSAHAPQERRVAAADALARAWLDSPLDDLERGKVRAALFALLDDRSAAVRGRVASVLAPSDHAPKPVILKLLDDVPDVCVPVYALSPLLQAWHLQDGLARGEGRIAEAIAGRADLDDELTDRVLRDGGPAACQALLANPHARLGERQLTLYAETYADDGDAIAALFAYRKVPLESVCALIARRADALSGNAFVRSLVPPERLQSVAISARERALADLVEGIGEDQVEGLFEPLASMALITPSLLMRFALGGRVAALEAAIATLSGLPVARVRSAFLSPRPSVAASLLKRTGLAEDVRIVVSMALVLARELARAEVPWTDGFFAETLLEVIEERASAADGADGTTMRAEVLALCQSLAAESVQAEARRMLVSEHAQPIADQSLMALPAPIGSAVLDDPPQAIDAQLDQMMARAVAA